MIGIYPTLRLDESLDGKELGEMTTNGFMADYGFERDPVYLTDMERCLPGESLAPVPKRRRWRTVEYESGELSGTMLVAWQETVAPDVLYPLSATGWHAVTIGAWKLKEWYKDNAGSVQLKVKLDSDDSFSELTIPTIPEPEDPIGGWDDWTGGEWMGEVFWKVADLTDQQLTIGQVVRRHAPGDFPGSFKCAVASIAYVKLVPLTKEEVAALQIDRNNDDNKRLFAHSDFTWKDPDQIRQDLTAFRDSDFSRIVLEAGAGDLMNYPTKIARIGTHEGLDDFAQPSYREEAEQWRSLQAEGIDPYKLAVDYIHDMGMECHAGYRVAGFMSPPAHDHFDYGETYYVQHPEYHGVDRDGKPTPRIAFSYPEVREYVVSLFREMATEYPIDGVSPLYCRRPPLVEYEPPLIEGFMAEYGHDPRELDERDLNWLKYRARALTEFMRQLRKAMVEIGARSGRHLQISAIVMKDEEENLYYGMDLRAWVAEGLVDVLIPFSSHPEYNMEAEAWSDTSGVEFFRSLIEGTSCELSFNIQPSGMAPGRLRHRASELYRAGAESLSFWNTPSKYSEHWTALRRLGHTEELEAWRGTGELGVESRSISLSRHGGWNTSYITPG